MFNLPITSYYSGLEPFLACNMNTLGRFNPMLYGIINPNSTNPMMDPLARLGIQNAMQMGATQAKIDMTSMAAASANNALNSMISQLSAVLQSDKLNESQKSRVNALIEKIKKVQQDLQSVMSKLNASNIDEVKSNVEKIQQQILDLQKEASDLADAIAKELQDEAGSASSNDDATDGTDDNSGSSNGGASGAGDSTGTDVESEYDADGRPSSLAKPTSREVQDICLAFADGISAWYGTDDEKFEAAVTSIDESNVVEVMARWKESFAGSGNRFSQDSSFIESFLWDADASQKEVLGKHILDMLVKRAELNGLDVTREEANVRAELSAIVTNNDKVQENIEAIYNKIVAKEAQNASQVKNKEAKAEKEDANKKAQAKRNEDAKKAQTAKKQAEVIAREKATFIKDIQDCTGRDDIKELPEGVEIVKDENGNFKGFKIRIKGKDYFGKDYLALVGALEEAGLTLPLPKKQEQVA